ncbi:CPBP family intramembrane metalloprotease domain-containing protein [Actinomadura craniellae]|uniref:CPBP family intramembrane metalloprotease domain-containing protein n=1 Tax=Actinomadura craniellae TaxID=2231787 RepID=A0A365H2E9_9ACTN|nr:CPBP family intramembrane glutamic endopeptidase [Actinomadura craniellae]RAY13277.1 CPBP family intramembrane metalloprotease domain-containing protein [Actinomadura craniellae]
MRPAPRPVWTVPAPPGSPYHRLARTPLHRWWRLLVGSLLILVSAIALMIPAGVAVAVIHFATGGGEPVLSETEILGDPTADLALQLVLLAVFIPPVLFAAWVVQRRRPGTLSSVLGRLRWRWLLLCCGLAVVACLLSVGLAYLVEELFPTAPPAEPEHWVGWSEFLLPAVLILLLVPFQATAEEYVFRGWLLQGIAACTLETRTGRIGRAASAVFRTPWPAIAVSGVLFTAGHGYTGWGLLDIFGFAVLAGWLAVRTGGLEASIAIHVFNNLMAFWLIAAFGQLDSALQQGDVPLQTVIADLIPLAVYGALVVFAARWRRVATVSPPAGDRAPVPAS